MTPDIIIFSLRACAKTVMQGNTPNSVCDTARKEKKL